jgi:alpha/beta superfamily hydrolase
MVTKGQLLERPVVIPTGAGSCLDGIYLRGAAPPLLIAAPLPGAGGSMLSPPVNELAYAAAYAGRASLRLDYRGVGASEGAQSPELGAAVEDLREGLAHLLESVPGSSTLAVAGWDTGCWAALALARADPRVDRLILVCPPEGPPPEGAPTWAQVELPTLLVVGVPDPERDLRAERDRLRGEAPHVRVELIRSADRALREGLGALQRLVPPFLGAERRA